jgi:SHS2 domain-containing protein
MSGPNAGFREIEHTADWELEVWAPDFIALLEQAARGMYELSGTRLQTIVKQQVCELSLPAGDPEQLLVSFLSELLWLGEREGLAFDHYYLELVNDQLLARVEGAPIAAQAKEIKAVTFHNLAIQHSETGLKVNIVFDV